MKIGKSRITSRRIEKRERKITRRQELVRQASCEQARTTKTEEEEEETTEEETRYTKDTYELSQGKQRRKPKIKFINSFSRSIQV